MIPGELRRGGRAVEPCARSFVEPDMKYVLPVSLVVVCCCFAVRAQAVALHYEAYAAGVNVIDMDADFAVDPARYHVVLAYKAVGPLGLLSTSHQKTTVDGHFAGNRPVPERFYSSGVLRGENRLTEIDYAGGQPRIRQMAPPNEKEREAVAPVAQANTVDTLSAMAQLINQVNTTHRCEGTLMTFDGRRLATLSARTMGEQPLEKTGRSSFAGPTLRCEFSGRQLGGFKTDEDRAVQEKVQQGTAWFAALTPGGPMVPVRIAFRTKWFGEATMYLAQPSGS